MMKALTGTTRPAATGSSGTVVTMARAAPKLAAPKCRGERARQRIGEDGLHLAPASKAAPTTIAMTAMGMRMSQTTVRTWAGTGQDR